MAEKQYKIKTTLGTLEKCGDLLQELGLGEMIGLKDVDNEKSVSDLILKLTAGRKLREFLNIITDETIGNEDIEISVATGLFKGFMMAIGKDIKDAIGNLPIAEMMKQKQK